MKRIKRALGVAMLTSSLFGGLVVMAPAAHANAQADDYAFAGCTTGYLHYERYRDTNLNASWANTQVVGCNAGPYTVCAQIFTSYMGGTASSSLKCGTNAITSDSAPGLDSYSYHSVSGGGSSTSRWL